MKHALPLLGLTGLLLCSAASAQPPTLTLQTVPRSARLLSVVLPSAGGSANPMNLSAWAVLLGAGLGVASGVAFLMEEPAAVPLLAIGLTLILVGPSLSHF